MSTPEQNAYSRGYAAGVRRGRRIAQAVRAEIARLRAAAPENAPTPRPVPAAQTAGRAHMPIHLPGWSGSADIYWPTDLQAADLELVRNQCVLVLDRWIKARKMLDELPDQTLEESAAVRN